MVGNTFGSRSCKYLFSIRPVGRYRLTVGDRERHDVLIEKHREIVVAGLSTPHCHVFVDGEAVGELKAELLRIARLPTRSETYSAARSRRKSRVSIAVASRTGHDVQGLERHLSSKWPWRDSNSRHAV